MKLEATSPEGSVLASCKNFTPIVCTEFKEGYQVISLTGLGPGLLT